MFLFICFFTVFLSAPLNADDGGFNLPDIEELQLENGMRLLIVPNYNNPVIYISAYINIGELDNPIDKIGLARFAFQELEQASKKYPKEGQIKDKLFALGSEDGSFRYMQMDNTRGYIENYCLKEDTRECIELISEVIVNPTFPEFGKFHKTNIIYFSPPKVWYQDEYLAKLHSLNLFANRFMYLNYNYLQRFYNNKDMRNWYNGHIRPENITLMITGDISAINIKKIVNEYFGNWMSSDPMPEQREYPINISNNSGIKLRFIDSKDRKDAKIRIIIRGPSYNDNWRHAGDLAGIVFGNQYMDVDIGFTADATPEFLKNYTKNAGFSSRIAKIHQIFNGYGVLYSNNYSSPRLSYTMLHSDTKYSDLSRLYHEIKSEFENLSNNSITELELEQAKAKRINYYKTRLDHPEKFSHFIQDNYNNNGFSINTISTLWKEVNRVTLDETNAAADKIFDPNNFMIVVIGNKDSSATFLDQFQDIEYYEQFEELDRRPEPFYLIPYLSITLLYILPVLLVIIGAVKGLIYIFWWLWHRINKLPPIVNRDGIMKSMFGKYVWYALGYLVVNGITQYMIVYFSGKGTG